MSQGYGFLFDEQIINYSTQGRDQSYDLVAEAIQRAVDFSSKKLKQSETEAGGRRKNSQADIHGDTAPDLLQEQLRKAILGNFESVEDAFNTFSNDEGVVAKKGWKRAVKLLPLSPAEAKLLRTSLPKKANLEAFLLFAGVAAATDEAQASNDSGTCGLAKLPVEVPQLPPRLGHSHVLF
jgi:hypothetical protein